MWEVVEGFKVYKVMHGDLLKIVSVASANEEYRYESTSEIQYFFVQE